MVKVNVLGKGLPLAHEYTFEHFRDSEEFTGESDNLNTN